MKRLFRSRSERVLGGVCGGLGEYLDTDPVVIRLLWVLLTLISLGTGLLIYLIAWIIIPEQEPGAPEGSMTP
jgi:phage shock protein PspC (stress-responsive transcriptional regulator)